MVVFLSFGYQNIFGLLLKNLTTIEELKGTIVGNFKNRYDMGPWKNFTQFFGDNPFLFLFPVIQKKG